MHCKNLVRCKGVEGGLLHTLNVLHYVAFNSICTKITISGALGGMFHNWPSNKNCVHLALGDDDATVDKDLIIPNCVSKDGLWTPCDPALEMNY